MTPILAIFVDSIFKLGKIVGGLHSSGNFLLIRGTMVQINPRCAHA